MNSNNRLIPLVPFVIEVDESRAHAVKRYGNGTAEHASGTEMLLMAILNTLEEIRDRLPTAEAIPPEVLEGLASIEACVMFHAEAVEQEPLTEPLEPSTEAGEDTSVDILKADAKVNLNQAEVAELKELPYVGEVVAARIVETRPFEDFPDFIKKANLTALSRKEKAHLSGLVVFEG